MNDEKRDFDSAAASWDKKPRRIKLSNDIAEAIASQVPLNENMDVLDFGCGTGLLALNLQPHVHSVTGVDSSRGMLDELEEKVRKSGLENVETLQLDIEKGDVLEGSYHLVVSAMTLHHIRNINPLLVQFHNILVPGGYLCIADLDAEEGRFHGDNTGVHHFGFDRAELEKHFALAGFGNVKVVTAAEIVKEETGERFSVFLITGRKLK